MTELEKFQQVNNCRSLEDLANLIELFANNEGKIVGSHSEHSAKKMADACRELINNQSFKFNRLTRNYGIRQQALYLKTYY